MAGHFLPGNDWRLAATPSPGFWGLTSSGRAGMFGQFDTGSCLSNSSLSICENWGPRQEEGSLTTDPPSKKKKKKRAKMRWERYALPCTGGCGRCAFQLIAIYERCLLNRLHVNDFPELSMLQQRRNAFLIVIAWSSNKILLMVVCVLPWTKHDGNM